VNIPKIKKRINGDLLLKPFKNKLKLCLSKITKNLSCEHYPKYLFLMIFSKMYNLFFKEKITIIQNLVGRKVVKGTFVYKSFPTPSRSLVHMAQVCHFILVMKVNN